MTKKVQWYILSMKTYQHDDIQMDNVDMEQSA